MPEDLVDAETVAVAATEATLTLGGRLREVGTCRPKSCHTIRALNTTQHALERENHDTKAISTLT